MTRVPEAEAELGLEAGPEANVWAIERMLEHRDQEEVVRADMKLVVDVPGAPLYGGQNGLLFKGAEPDVEATEWGVDTRGWVDTSLGCDPA